MSASVTMDYLMSQSSGNTLYCTLSTKVLSPLIKEAIIRGLQVRIYYEGDLTYPLVSCSNGCGHALGRGDGDGGENCSDWEELFRIRDLGDGLGYGLGEGWGGYGSGKGHGCGDGSYTPGTILGVWKGFNTPSKIVDLS